MSGIALEGSGEFHKAWQVAKDDYERFIAAYHLARGQKSITDKLKLMETSLQCAPTDKEPFYHGTKADLQIGNLLTSGGNSNYKPGLKMNYIYFTANVNGAGLAAAFAKGEGRERVYIIEPTGEFENDPNATYKNSLVTT